MFGFELLKRDLERRLALQRWAEEDSADRRAQAMVEAARAPALERRERELERRGLEEARIAAGSVTPVELRGRLDRIAAEDAAWRGLVGRWDKEDRALLMRREQHEGHRCAEIDRWLDDDAWSGTGESVSAGARCG